MRQEPHEAQQLQLQPQPTPHRATAHRATPHRATAQRATAQRAHLATAHLPQRPQAQASCISSLSHLGFAWVEYTKKVAKLTSDISSSPSVMSWPGK